MALLPTDYLEEDAIILSQCKGSINMQVKNCKMDLILSPYRGSTVLPLSLNLIMVILSPYRGSTCLGDYRIWFEMILSPYRGSIRCSKPHMVTVYFIPIYGLYRICHLDFVSEIILSPYRVLSKLSFGQESRLCSFYPHAGLY